MGDDGHQGRNARKSARGGIAAAITLVLVGAGGVTAAVPPPRDPALWPFAQRSPWNYPLGSQARYERPSTGLRAAGDLVKNGFAAMGVNIVCGGTVYVGSSRDPVRAVQTRARTASGGPTYVYRTNTFPQNVPASAIVHIQCSDQPLSLIGANHLTALDFESAQRDSSSTFFTANPSSIMHVDLEGPGWGPAQGPLAPNGTYNPDGQTAAAVVPMFAGILRQGEVRAPVPHSLAILTHFHDKNRNAPGGTCTAVWPGAGVDGYCGNAGDPQYGGYGNMYMGSLLAVPASVNIAALGLKTPEAANIAYALQRYGGYIVDTGAWEGGFQVKAEWQAGQTDFPGISPSYTGTSSPTDFQQDLAVIARLVQVVTNSFSPGGRAPQSGVKLNGGDGPLLAPLAPPFGAAWGGGIGRP